MLYVEDFLTFKDYSSIISIVQIQCTSTCVSFCLCFIYLLKFSIRDLKGTQREHCLNFVQRIPLSTPWLLPYQPLGCWQIISIIPGALLPVWLHNFLILVHIPQQ